MRTARRRGQYLLAMALAVVLATALPGTVLAAETDVIAQESVLEQADNGESAGDQREGYAVSSAAEANPALGKEEQAQALSALESVRETAPEDEELVGAPTYTSVDTIAAVIREAMVSRRGSLSINVRISTSAAGSSDPTQAALNLVDLACAHTGDGQRGDYLRLSRRAVRAQAGYYTASLKKGVIEGTLTYTFLWLCSAKQEQAVSTREKQILSSLALSGKSEAQKVKAIYSYVCSHVSYDSAGAVDPDNYLCHSAYSAVVQGKSVCQGYALMLYRLLNDSGIPCRILTGRGGTSASDLQNHAWNIVRLNQKYYNLDATWDSEEQGRSFDWFLRGSGSFPWHYRDSRTSAASFAAAYSVSSTDYPGVSLTPATLTLPVGDTGTLSGFSTAGTSEEMLSWSSSDPAVAAVDQTGRVTALSPGSAQITATDGAGRSGSARVTVKALVPVTGLSLSSGSLSLYAGKSATLRARVSPANASHPGVTWISEDSSVASVDAAGKVTGRAAGSTVIRALSAEGKLSASCKVRVLFADMQGEPSWAQSAVNWGFFDAGITSGVTGTAFGPGRDCTREQIVTFLYSLAGKPQVQGGQPFADVKSGRYYDLPVRWAAQQGITSGVSKEKFGVGQKCTRAQIVTFLYRYAGSPDFTATRHFSDVRGGWMKRPVEWAAATGITNGVTQTSFGPYQPCTRAQAMAFLQRLQAQRSGQK